MTGERFEFLLGHRRYSESSTPLTTPLKLPLLFPYQNLTRIDGPFQFFPSEVK